MIKINRKYLGIFYIIVSAFCFALMNTFVRLSGDIPTVQKSFFRNLISLMFAFVLLKKNKVEIKWHKGNLKFHFIRSIAGTIGILCNFYAVDHMVLSDASMLNKMSPFFAIIFSLIFLKEKVSLTQVIIVISAFLGSLFIIKPTFIGMEFFPAVIGFLGGMGAGAAYTTVRYLGQNGENGTFIVFFFSLFSCLVTLPYLLINFHSMTIVQMIYLICAGLTAAAGQFSITAAYRCSPAKEISVYDYTQIIFSAILGLIIFQHIPDMYSIIGYIIIIISAVIMFVLNNRNRDNYN